MNELVNEMLLINSKFNSYKFDNSKLTNLLYIAPINTFTFSTIFFL